MVSLSRDEFQQREKCIEMLEQLMNVPKTVLQDGVQRWLPSRALNFQPRRIRRSLSASLAGLERVEIELEDHQSAW